MFEFLSNFLVRPVAEWFIGTGLTTTPSNLFFLHDFHKHWPHPSRPVGTIAKWLLLGLTAAAPYISARFDIHNKGMIVFVHLFKVSIVAVDNT
jgi:hypothetical protein